MQTKEGELVKERETDLLLGIVSFADSMNSHYLLADFDNISEAELVKKITKPLFVKRRFGTCYVIRSGKGFHVVSFSKKLSTKEYIKVLSELKGDPMYLMWVKRVKYGVLRLSRRSSHGIVPHLAFIIEGHKVKEDIDRKLLYFSALNFENSELKVRRVKVCA